MVSLATTEAGARRRGVAVVMMAGIVVFATLLLPFAHLPVTPLGTLSPFFIALAFSSNLITSYLLFTQSLINRLPSLAVLGTGYLFAGLMGLPYTFAGSIKLLHDAHGGLGGYDVDLLQATWSGGFILAVFAYIAFEANSRPRAPRRLTRALVAIAVVTDIVIIALIATRLPQGTHIDLSIDVMLTTLDVIALIMVVRTTHCRTIIHLWLTVSLLIVAIGDAFTLIDPGRSVVAHAAAIIGSVLGTSFLMLAMLVEMNVIYLRLNRMATVDDLTGLANRRTLDDRFPALIRDAVRRSEPISVLMIDVDHFKHYNDRYGHLAGDEALRAVSSAIAGSLARSLDFAARFGGEEFIVILPNTDRLGVSLLGERIREHVERETEQASRKRLPQKVTVSVGAVSAHPQEPLDPRALIAAADAALYSAKAAGRNVLKMGTSGGSSENSQAI